MARWAVVFENAVGHSSLSDRQHPVAHHTYLSQYRDVIRLAGAISEDDGELFVGGIWVVQADDRDTVRGLVEGSPFFISGAHSSYRLFWWGSAPGFESAKIVDA